MTRSRSRSRSYGIRRLVPIDYGLRNTEVSRKTSGRLRQFFFI